MKRLTEESEIRDQLAKYEFNMLNRKNRYSGEITTLDEKDINDITKDLRLGPLAPVVSLSDEGVLEVVYPNNVCKLISTKERLE